MTKKTISFLLILILCVGILTSCSFEKESDKISIVTTIFPLYDWTRQIVGDNANIILLNSNGTDMHSYQPTTDDIVRLSTCDMLIYIGGDSDFWIEDALKNAVNKDMTVINVLEFLEISEDDEHDEHIWLSLRYASKVCQNICEKISLIDSENADIYKANKNSYIFELSQLDNEYTDAINASSTKTLLFADRFPFKYFTDDYGLDYYTAFDGCSAESEASFETVVFLAKKIDELLLPAVFIIDGSTTELANTVISSASSENVKILSLNSMQSVTLQDITDGITYLSVMQSNLNVLKETL